MQNDSKLRLVEQLHQELRALPPVPAPPTLIPRVLAALEAHAQVPWYKRSWTDWPLPMRWAFVVLSLAIGGGLTYAGLHLNPAASVGAVEAAVADWFGFLKPAWNVATALGGALVLLLRSGGQVLWWGTVAVVGAIYLASLGLGTMCYRVATNRI